MQGGSRDSRQKFNYHNQIDKPAVNRVQITLECKAHATPLGTTGTLPRLQAVNTSEKSSMWAPQ